MFGLTFEKLLVVLVLAAVIVGPHRLPLYAQRLGALLRGVRAFVEATRARVETEVGTTLAVDEWRSLDPRQYDPRRIVREALAAPAPDVTAAPEAAIPPASEAVTGLPAELAPEPAPAPLPSPARSGGGGIADLIARGAAARAAEPSRSDAPRDLDGSQEDCPAESVRQADAAVSA